MTSRTWLRAPSPTSGALASGVQTCADRSVLAVETRGLSKSYGGLFGRGGRMALGGVDLALPAGTAFGLIGPNGAGKTTFIKALLHIVQPSAGEVRLLGGSPADPAVRARIGYLPERLELPPAWTPLQFLASVARLRGLPRAGDECERLVGVVGLRADAERRIGGFSKGMRQRLGLAAAFLGSPDLLILDEPTDGLDPIARVEVRALLVAQVARGTTLILNSHLLSETERVCHRVGILAGGKLVRQGTLDELRASTGRFVARFVPGVDPAKLIAAGFRPGPHPETWEHPGDADALDLALARAREAGARLVELGQPTPSLEEVLVSTMERAA